MCNETVDAFLLTLEFVPGCFVTNKMLEKFDNTLISNDDIDLDDLNSDTITFFSDAMGLVTIYLNNIDLDLGEDDPTNIVLVRFIDWCKRFKKWKAYKKW